MSSIGDLRANKPSGTLRRVQRGVNLSGVLPALLSARDWTHEKLGAEASIARTDITAFCNGKRVGEVRLARIAKALNMRPDDLRQAASTPDDDERRHDLDDLLERLQAEADPDTPMSWVAEALVLLTRRLALAERQLALVS